MSSVFHIEKIIRSNANNVYNSFINEYDNMHWHNAGFGWGGGVINIDPKVGGGFDIEFKSPDGLSDFHLRGKYISIIHFTKIVYQLEDGRMVIVEFNTSSVHSTKIKMAIEAESENTVEKQTQGWQAILDNFAKFVQLKYDSKNATIHRTITINAPASKIWKVLLDQDTYTQWTEPFDVGQGYESTLEVGSPIKFNGEQGSLSSKIITCIKDYQISFEHDSYLDDQGEIESSEFQGFRETYTLIPQGESIVLDIFANISQKESDFFNLKWQECLVIIKYLSEKK